MNDQSSTAVAERKPRVQFASVPERQEAFLEALRTEPCYGNFTRAAAKVNVDPSTIYKFIQREPEFGDLVAEAETAGKQEWWEVHVDHAVNGVLDRIDEEFYPDGSLKKRTEHRKTDFRDRAVLDRMIFKDEPGWRDEDAAAKRMEVTHRVYHHDVDAAMNQLSPEALLHVQQALEEFKRQQAAQIIDVEATPAVGDQRDAG